MRKLFIISVFLGILGGCVFPKEDAENSHNCELVGLEKGSENHKICRQWLNADLIAASDNYIFAPKRTFSDFACLGYHKIPEESPEYLKCHEKYEQAFEQIRQYYVAQKEKSLKDLLDADQHKCKVYGFKRGTTEFADCMMKQEAQRKTGAVINEIQKSEEQARIEAASKRQFNAGLAIMQGVPSHEAYMMQDDPEGYRQYKMQETLEEIHQDTKNINCTSRKDNWGNINTHCY
jgi:hypothetical protein